MGRHGQTLPHLPPPGLSLALYLPCQPHLVAHVLQLDEMKRSHLPPPGAGELPEPRRPTILFAASLSQARCRLTWDPGHQLHEGLDHQADTASRTRLWDIVTRYKHVRHMYP